MEPIWSLKKVEFQLMIDKIVRHAWERVRDDKKLPISEWSIRRTGHCIDIYEHFMLYVANVYTLYIHHFGYNICLCYSSSLSIGHI